LTPELRAESAWQQVDLLSDLHLGPETPQTLARLARHLAETPAQAVFLLGDVFEVWVGDDARFAPCEQRIVQMLKAASSRLKLFFLPGNRDFLVGKDMLTDCGMPEPLADPTVLEAFGQRWLLSHGDAQCLGDAAYQRLRLQLRDPTWQQALLAKPLAERRAFAKQARDASRSAQAAMLMDAELDADTCRAQLKAAKAQVLIHGHTHRPALHDLGEGLQRYVLSDWDFDSDGAVRGDVLRLSAAGLERIAL
jgi:UDP-2,3-diacylglucosamine hydrolase